VDLKRLFVVGGNGLVVPLLLNKNYEYFLKIISLLFAVATYLTYTPLRYDSVEDFPTGKLGDKNDIGKCECIPTSGVS